MSKLVPLIFLVTAITVLLTWAMLALGFYMFITDFHYLVHGLQEGTVCTIALAPDEYLKENKKLIKARALELNKKWCFSGKGQKNYGDMVGQTK